MRKGLLIAVVALGSVITGSAQTSQAQYKLTAAHVQRNNGRTFFSDSVEIVVAGVRVRADNATFHSDTNTVDVTGHVQLTLPAK